MSKQKMSMGKKGKKKSLQLSFSSDAPGGNMGDIGHQPGENKSSLLEKASNDIQKLGTEYESKSALRPVSAVSVGKKPGTSANNPTTTLGRIELFDKFEAPYSYPLDQIKSIIDSIGSKKNVKLDFTGVEQLTDIVFATFYEMDTSKKLAGVTHLVLQGCLHITDKGLEWASTCFPKLKLINLAGCGNITEDGLNVLLFNCKELNTLDLTATNISIVPRSLAKKDVILAGCPLVSPDWNTLEKNGMSFLENPVYGKPTDQDVICISVIKSASVKNSFIKFLNQEKKLTPAPAEYLPNYTIGSTNITANIIEHEQCVMDLVLTKRSLYVLTYEGQNTQEIVVNLFSTICSILSKFHTGFFLIVGLNESKTKKSENPQNVIKEIEKMASASVKKLDAMINLTDKDKLKNISFETQQHYGRGQALKGALSMLKMKHLSVDLDTDVKNQPSVNLALETGSKSVIGLYPAFQEINKPLFLYLTSDKIQETLKGGILSVKESPDVARKSMELQQIVGKAVCLTLDIDMPVVCEMKLLMSILCTIQGSPPNGSINQTQIPSLTNHVPVWVVDKLQEKFQEKIPKEQITAVTGILSKFPIGMYSSVYASFKNMDMEPMIDPSTDFEFDFDKKGNLRRTKFVYSFSHHVSSNLTHRITHMCSKIRKPMCIWQNGFIMQEGLAELLVQLKHSAGSSQLIVVAQSPLVNKDHEESTHGTTEMVWQLILQYKILVDYVVQIHGLSAVITCESDIPKPGKVEGTVASHKMASIEGEGENRPIFCQLCGMSGSSCQLLQAAKHVVHPGMMPQQIGAKQNTVEVFGNLVSNKDAEGSFKFSLSLTPYDQNVCKFTILDYQSSNIEIAIGPLQFSLSSGIIRMKDTAEKVGEMKPAAQGDTYSFVMVPFPDKNNMYGLMILREGALLSKFTFPSRSYSPQIKLGNSGQKDKIMLHGFTPLSAVTDLEIGMRLEALDRLNPSLICCATIANIDENGKLLIHFDGWTSRYDYWTEPESADLHPVGFMAVQGERLQRERRKTPQLQIPHGYSGEFTWEKYCKEIDKPPVPYSFFSEAQLEGTDSTLIDLIYSEFGLATLHKTKKQENGQMICTTSAKTSRRLEFMMIQKTSLTTDVVQFFSSHKRLFCLFPQTLSIKDVRYPSLARTILAPKQNIHFLCPGLRMEILHFVNDSGLPFDKYCPKSTTVHEFAPFLNFCYTGVLLQEVFLPSQYDKIIACPSDINKEEVEALLLGMKRLCFIYMLWTEAITNTFKNKSVGSDDRMKLLLNIGKDEEATKQLANHFKGFDGDGYNRCIGHFMSVGSNKTMGSVKMETYDSYSQFLQRLDFKDSNLETLPENFFTTFFRLEELDISDNKLTKLPNGIQTSQYLTHLNISSNNISVIPEDIKDLKDTLNFINISNNPLKELPACIFDLENLVELHASNIGYIKDMKAVKKLVNLEKLILAFNVIESVPDELGDIPLVELNLSGVPWFPYLVAEKIHPTFQKFQIMLDQYIVYRMMTEQQKRELFSKVDKDANGTLEVEELIQMNQLLFELNPRFGRKKLDFERSGGVPGMIFKLTKLEKLVLRFHAIKEFPEMVGNLRNLHSIDLSSNPNLVSLSPSTGLLPLEDLGIEDCPSLKTPPREVVERGFNAVFGYLKRLGAGAVSCRRTKLMIVGLGGAGKTSLSQALMSKRGYGATNYEEAITDGIDIVNWKVPIANEEPIQYGVWDFAGQTVYYNTHQFFLSNRAVYMLLWNIRLGYEHAGLDFWLSSIACHAPKAPILVVGTHCDKVEKSSIPETYLQKLYPQIAGFYYVSSYTGEGVSNLRDNLIRITLEQKYMGERIPEAWLSMESEILQFKEKSEKSLDLLPWQDVDQVAASCGIIDENEVIQAVEFLHDLGSVQFFNTEFLKGYVVIHPQWIVDVMACVVTVHVGPVKEGKILHKDMKTIWKDYPTSIHPWLLRLTEEFDLTFPLKEEDANLVPCLLPDTEYVYDWPAVNFDNGETEAKIVYNFKYLPAGLFNRAQVRLHGFSEGGKIWKKGMILKKNGHLAVMLQPKPAQVTVKAQGFKPENILFLVHEVFDSLITEAYSGVQYDFQIPCIECNEMHLSDPSMFSASRIQRAMELQAPFVQCENMFHTLSIPELKAVMPPSMTADFDNHLRRSIQELHDIDEDLNVNIFFVYSSRNIPKKEELNTLVNPLTVMEDMRIEGINVSFCDNPETASLETLTLAFKAAKLVLIGISDEFCFDNQCKQLLLYVKETLRKPIQLIVFGKGKKWESSDLALNIGSEVYVKMDSKDRYPVKIKELFDVLKKTANTKTGQTEDIPKCFLSYCWSNSKDAIDKGTKPKEGSLGWGDPRYVKKFLADNGVNCWIDIERLAGGGLFENIAEGLRKAKVIVACVSDEYAESTNCVMEFRFAAAKLKIPMILAVVGTGYQWEHTEVGLLAVGNKVPKVSLQYDNPGALNEILKFVKEKLPKDEETDAGNTVEQRETSFKEVLEMSQRQFLRQVTNFSQTQFTNNYPRLIVIDFKDKDAEKENVPEVKKGEEDKENVIEKKAEDELEPTPEPKDKDENKSRFCYKLLCEHEEGWHDVAPAIPFQELGAEEEEEWLQEMAPYCARIMAILKYTNLSLDCLNTAEGKLLQQRFENVVSQDNSPNFKKAYTSLWRTVINLDSEKHYGGLKFCHILNGKKLWLCQKHSQEASSKTEKKYKDELTVKTSDSVKQAKPAAAMTPKNTMEKKTTEPAAKPQVFQMRQTAGTKQGRHRPDLVKRQTSQACNVM